MTRKEAIDIVKCLAWHDLRPSEEDIEQAIKELEQEPTTKNNLGVDCISKQAVICTIYDNKSDFKNDFAQGFFADKIRELPSVTPQEPFINKPCISSGVCEHDKQKVLDKIRAEIEEHAKINQNLNIDRVKALCWCLDVIDKYKTESEDKE